MNWGDLREEEFENVIKETDGLCIIPVGCYEMHGQHLPVRTDVYEAEAIAMAAAEIEPACVFPAFEFGSVAGLVSKKGSIRLEPSLMIKLLENMCDEAYRNGFDKILLLNFHGGNTYFLNHFISTYRYTNKQYTVLYQFPANSRAKYNEILENVDKHGLEYYPELLPEDIKTIRSLIEENKVTGHGCLMETSMMLAIRPDTVNMDRMNAVSGVSTHKGDKLSEGGFVTQGWSYNFPNCYAGEPEGASARIGRLLIKMAAEQVAKACKTFKEENYLFKESIEERSKFYID